MAAELTYFGDTELLNMTFGGGFVNRIHLFKNNFVPNGNSVLADFTEADFDGYAPVVLTWGSAFVNAVPQGQINAGSVTWVKGAGVITNTVYGIYLTDGTGLVVGYELFPAPVPMVVPFVDNIFYQLSPTANSI